MTWQVGFAAVSALLGERAEHVVAAMGGEAAARGPAQWLLALAGQSREERAREIARAVALLAADLESGRIL